MPFPALSHRLLIGACATLAGVTALLSAAAPLSAQAPAEHARTRWERLCQIRRDQFDLILPRAMRDHGVDMWIVMQKENQFDPMYDDLGRGYVGSVAYWIFTDRGGDHIERVAIGVAGYRLEDCGYDLVRGFQPLQAFIAERNPKRIGVNMSEAIGAADGLSKTSYDRLLKELGPTYASRVVSAERVVSDFRSGFTASRLVALGENGELARRLADRALSNEIITPGVTTLEDVAWWMANELQSRALGSSFEMPSVYITGPRGIEATSNDRIIQRGDLLMIDWGVGYLNTWTDVKRVAYVLKPGETSAPAGLQKAFDNALAVRRVIRNTIKAGPTAGEMLTQVTAAIEAAGFRMQGTFNEVTNDQRVEVMIGCHSIGDRGHGSGPSIAWFNPAQHPFPIKPFNPFSIELFAWTPVPEWGGAKARIPLEDDAIVTERGVEWFYPINERIRLIK
ncbi:MAG: aminopeptidase P family protein [Gemmatimonadaceae bacterium]|jgi:Xaa-Pro aminopeptidase|nr:aminopeptidase P family protein [Gemmatimonadaceae bacterium]